MTSVLITLLGAMWRQGDGRGGLTLWNCYLYFSLPFICLHLFGMTWQAWVVAGLTAVNLLLGCKSLTIPWVVYNFKILMRQFQEPYSWEIGGWVEAGNKLEHDFEKSNGWHTPHIFYRFVPLALLNCFVLGSFNLVYIALHVVAGAGFYITHHLKLGDDWVQAREALWGAIAFGGLTLLG